MAMDIYSKPGSVIKYSNPDNGPKMDQDLAAKYLILGEEYIVYKTEVFNFHTKVYLIDFPDIEFNSVLFENVYSK